MKDTFPSLIVFDLDFTIWDCGGSWIDATIWPFEHKDGKVCDAEGREFMLYPDVWEVLDRLAKEDVQLALASRTTEPEWAEWLLETWKLKKHFHHTEIYPGSKITHFKRLQKATDIAFDEMLFFDDEERNIREVGDLGVTAIHVQDGIGHDLLEQGLESWRSKPEEG